MVLSHCDPTGPIQSCSSFGYALSETEIVVLSEVDS